MDSHTYCESEMPQSVKQSLADPIVQKWWVPSESQLVVLASNDARKATFEQGYAWVWLSLGIHL